MSVVTKYLIPNQYFKIIKAGPHRNLYMVSLIGKRKEQMKADEVILDVAKDSGKLLLLLLF